jgi:hypothetical protein
MRWRGGTSPGCSQPPVPLQRFQAGVGRAHDLLEEEGIPLGPLGHEPLEGLERGIGAEKRRQELLGGRERQRIEPKSRRVRAGQPPLVVSRPSAPARR